MIVISEIVKKYGDKKILDKISLRISPQDFITVVGPSGCGKTTLLKLILGQELITSGTIKIDNKEIGFADPSRGVVYQKYSLYPYLTVMDNVLLGPQLVNGYWRWRKNKKEIMKEAMSYLDRVGLVEHADKYPHELSGGMRQRSAIAQALIMKPKILLMDEPFGALDPGTRERMQVFVTELWEEFGMTILFVTHDLEEAIFLGSRIIAISQYYTNGSKDMDSGKGAKVVFDENLGWAKAGTSIKASPVFGELLQNIRRSAFNPKYLQHIDEFNKKHE
ncbi:ABC transporter ATP-binding protein [Patescibacteria group bacterium]